MSPPLSPRFAGDMTRHVRVLRRAGHTWAEVARLTGLAVETCRRMAPEDRRKKRHPPLFVTVTRVHANGEALVGRTVP
jgi:hypothetical protein